ncbi:MAG: AsmA family protein [Rhodocyclaceae bacterium]|nr:AsmA family protein [Rhodocyclaceae bacterium]
MKRTGTIVGILVLIVAIVVAAWDWNWFKGVIADRVRDRTGRDLVIEGDIDVDLSLTPTVRVRDIRFENAAWSDRGDMLSIGELSFRIALPALLRGRLVLPEVHLAAPAVLLEKAASGDANWALESPPLAVEAAVPDDRSEFPVIGLLTITDGRLRYLDPAAETDIEADLATVVGESEAAPDRFELTGQGRLRNSALRLTLTTGPLLALREGDAPFPVALDLVAGETEVHAKGTLAAPLALGGVDLRIRLKGPNPAALDALLDLPLPDLPPYDLRGHLQRDGERWHLRAFAGNVGDSDLAGEVVFDPGGERPSIDADLVSRKLDFDDLAGLIGGTPDPTETASPEQRQQAQATSRKQTVFPDKPIDLTRMRAVDASVRFEGKSILAPGLPLDNVVMNLRLQAGVATLQPLNFGIGRGNIRSNVRVDGTDEPPRIVLETEFENLDLRELLAEVAIARESFGRVGGRSKLRGAGDSVAAFMASVSGETVLAMTGGEIDSLLIEALGLDAGELLGALLAKDRNIPIRCAVADLGFDAGTMRVRTLVIDTDDSVVTGEGEVQLGSESLALTVEAHPKDFSLLSTRTPIHVTGRLKDPKVMPDAGGLAARGAVAAGLAVLLGPAAALIPLIEPGNAENSDCHQLLQRAKRASAN